MGMLIVREFFLKKTEAEIYNFVLFKIEYEIARFTTHVLLSITSSLLWAYSPASLRYGSGVVDLTLLCQPTYDSKWGIVHMAQL